MCGICGFNWQDRELAERMCSVLAHRGPDAQGVMACERLTMGHRRLAIIDLSERGRQPMKSEDGRVWAVVNGEIYNWRELRAELEALGHRFYSDSDSEVVVHGYEQWGEQLPGRLSGMFALAVADTRAGRMLLVRDRLGIKPLYYISRGGRVAFASEIKALLAWEGAPREVELQALYHYLGYEFVPAPRTLFKGINKLPAGCYAVVDLAEGTVKLKPYWELVFRPAFSRPQEAAEELRALLKESVRRRLMSDVPLGVFLSGGLDSTTVTALMRELGVEPLRSYCIAYPDPSFSELPYANAMASHYGTIHSVLMIDGLSVEDLRRAVWHLDEPMTDLSAIPLMLLCRRARQEVVVVLSGEGGDEVFCGYDRFKASRAARLLKPLPWVSQGLYRLSRLLKDRPQKKGAVNVFKRFAEGLVLPEEGLHMRWQYFLPPAQALALFNPDAAREIDFDPFGPVREVLRRCNSTDALDQEVFVDLRLVMPESVLMKVDKMSMSTALEVRVPMLDHEVVELTARMPGWFKLKGLTTKYVLRMAIRGLVPDKVVNRGKQGYSLPVKNLLRTQLRGLMQQLLGNSRLVKDYLVPDEVARLMREHLAGTHNHNHILWALMNAAMWHERFVEGGR